MTTNDKPLTRNYDSDKEKSEIDSDIRVLKLKSDSDLQRIRAEEIASTVCRMTSLSSLLVLHITSRIMPLWSRAQHLWIIY